MNLILLKIIYELESISNALVLQNKSRTWVRYLRKYSCHDNIFILGIDLNVLELIKEIGS